MLKNISTIVRLFGRPYRIAPTEKWYSVGATLRGRPLIRWKISFFNRLKGVKQKLDTSFDLKR